VASVFEGRLQRQFIGRLSAMLEHPLLWKFAILAVLIGVLLVCGAIAAVVDKLRARRATGHRFSWAISTHRHHA
jgi:uncharacterized protein involved in cysteine biosynthesis